MSYAQLEPVIAQLTDCPVSKKDEEPGVKMSFRKMEAEPQVSVGIMSAPQIRFSLQGEYVANGKSVCGEQLVEIQDGAIKWNGSLFRELTFCPKDEDSTFILHDVTIGVKFHWERQESQTFTGTLRFVTEEDKVVAINLLPIDDYLTSVISSEMKETCSLEFLKAAAVISRSWLLAQMEKRQHRAASNQACCSFTRTDSELIRWQDREDHTIFDVCADDHCQRYQGITRATNPRVAEAIRSTRGLVLVSKGEICDARFSKCCGGQTNEYPYCWENKEFPYLKSVRDPYCNTSDEQVLRQVLNDYDLETRDFYRWTVDLTQEELKQLLADHLKIEFGDIQDLLPLEKGPGGHISKLKIVGSERTFVIGKELEIRKALSKTHLKSSAFDVERLDVKDGVPATFRLHGSGWGHGVGMCQIGAAVMGQQGYSYEEILRHYYQNIQIQKLYE